MWFLCFHKLTIEIGIVHKINTIPSNLFIVLKKSTVYMLRNENKFTGCEMTV